MLGHVLRCHICSLSSVRFCQSDSISSEPVCEVSKKLLYLEQRSVIKFLTKEGNKPKEILECMVAVYGESAPSYYKVKFWSKQFKWWRDSIEDDPHTGCPVEATYEEMCQKLKSFILADRWMKVLRLAEETGTSAGAVWTINHEKLDMSKVSARWVPRILSPFQDTRRQCWQEILQLLTEDPEHIFLTFGDRRRDLGISQRSWDQNGVHEVEA